MKICAIICEYNPFHNGHKNLLSEAKKRSNADALLCIMSGNFVQRGEAAILEKHIRAKHAVLCGADAVIELPTVFATSNAEIFARGAISILSQIPNVTHLAFGAETADKQAFLESAKTLIKEPESVSKTVKKLTKSGMGYAQAISLARSEITGTQLFNTPNNILGIEYTKSILSNGANIDVLPIERIGSGYNDIEIVDNFPSATAIRNVLKSQNVENLSTALPECVVNDLPSAKEINLDTFEKIFILSTSTQKLAEVLDCTEGLENAFQSAATNPAPLIETLSSPRYTNARIRRIALHNLLGIREDFIRECLSSRLFIHPLAYKAERKDLLSALSKANIPFIATGKDKRALSGAAKRCLEADEHAEKIYSAISGKQFKNKTIVI